MHIIRIPIFYILLFFTTFIAYHTFFGQHSIASQEKLNKDIVKLEQELKLLEKEKQVLSTEISLISDDNLSIDSLERHARKNLGFILKNEKVIIIEQNQIN